MMPSEFSPGRLMVTETPQRVHVWVRDGKPTLTIITDAKPDLSINWPEDAGPLLIFDTAFEVTVTAVQP